MIVLSLERVQDKACESCVVTKGILILQLPEVAGGAFPWDQMKLTFCRLFTFEHLEHLNLSGNHRQASLSNELKSLRLMSSNSKTLKPGGNEGNSLSSKESSYSCFHLPTVFGRCDWWVMAVACQWGRSINWALFLVFPPKSILSYELSKGNNNICLTNGMFQHSDDTQSRERHTSNDVY